MVFDIFSDTSTINVLGTQVSVASLVIGAIIMVAGVVVARIISTLFKRYFATNLPGNVATNLHKLIYYGIIIVTLLAVITSQGIDLSGLMVAGGIFGIVIGFAAQSVVSNLFSGIFLMFDRPAKTGDLIEIPQSNTYGRLMDITIFSTRIKLFDGSIMRVPNEKIFTSEIRNVSGSEVRRLEVTLGIAYKEDIDHAIAVIKKAVSRLPYVLREPKPEVWTEQLADSGVNLKVLTWIPRDEWDNVGPILLKEVKKDIDDAGIEIPFPQRVVHYANNQGETR
ncbi:mechanosensitive ion channel family protein [Candidatus Nitrosotenuis aquarius]|uniref:mechanosensitive ion channel family protein n=1 Tax=Candidatus Nitrosotenuis aquarius TaxID=1846278 RepID=UPI000C1F0634|nr:mechanosensitive ion channel family protein [Candidatus Nitrosotenuis aquarius]